MEKEQWHKSPLWEKSLWAGRPDIYLFTHVELERQAGKENGMRSRI